MKVLVEVGPNLHFFEAVAVSIEGNEINITLPTLELAVIEASKDMVDYVKKQLADGGEPVYIRADEIRFSHVALVVYVEG